MTDDDCFTETYSKRRTIEAHKPTEVKIEKIGYKEDSKAKICMIINAADEYYFATYNKEDPIKSDYAISQLMEMKDDTISPIIKMFFGEDMEKCGFSEGNYNFDLDYIGKSVQNYDNSLTNKEDSINKLLLESEYNNASTLEEDGWRHEISDVYDIDSDSEKFGLDVYTENFAKIEWNLELPLSTEEESSQVAKLIEEQGGGRPDFLDDGGEVNIVRKSELPPNLESIAIDKTGQWVLVNPTVFDDWIESKKKREKTKNRGNGRSRSSRNNSSGRTSSYKRQKYRDMRRNALLYGFIAPAIIMYPMQQYVESMLDDPEIQSEEEMVNIIELTMSMIDMIILMGPIIGVLGFIVATIQLSQQK